jgi:hypothetical protein
MRDEPSEDPAVQKTPSNILSATLIGVVTVIAVVVGLVTWAIKELLDLVGDRDIVISSADPAVLLLPFGHALFHVWDFAMLKEDLKLPKLTYRWIG